MNVENKLTQLYKNRIVLHAGFWTVCIILGLFGEIGNEKNLFGIDQIIHSLIHFMGIMLASYFNLYYLIPQFLLKRNYQKYFLWVLLTATITTVLFQLVKFLIHKYFLYEVNPDNFLFMFFHISFYCLLLMMISTLFYFLRRRMNLKEMELKLQEVENQKNLAELKALKAQINPHLLFNALNNIYSLSLENNANTPKAVLELSELMNYVLYDCQTEKIELSKEIAFLKNYIQLEKMRFEDSLNVKLSIDETAASNATISPLLFLPFIENAFKHCNKSGKEKAEISISFDISKLPVLILEVTNTFEPELNEKENSGIGLENIRQRLAFLYPSKYTLENIIRGNEYYVKLELVLS